MQGDKGAAPKPTFLIQTTQARNPEPAIHKKCVKSQILWQLACFLLECITQHI